MLAVEGRSRRVCNGLTRRDLLRAGGAGLLGTSLTSLLAAEEAGIAARPRARSVLFLFLFGGPSQLETFDLKPDAASGIRGPYRPIASRTPGLLMCEHLPKLADISDRFAVIRTMSHRYNDHNACHYVQTGYPLPPAQRGAAGVDATAQDWPAMGSIVEYLDRRAESAAPGDRRRDFPSYVYLPNPLGHIQGYDRAGGYAGWLGSAYDGLATRIPRRGPDDNPYFRDCDDDEMDFRLQGLDGPALLTLERTRSRIGLLDQFDAARGRLDRSQAAREFGRLQERAARLMTSEAMRAAFDIRQEPARVRDRYGRHLFGQSALMGRRMIEAGARFVTVVWDAPDGYSWDSHAGSHDVGRHLLPGLDQTLSALLDDMNARGLLDETLVVCLGEMGRTPRPDTATWGRGHWSYCFPAVLAGAGIQGGVAYGRSDKDAAYPVDRPVSPEDLSATIFHALGIDPDARIMDPLGRPVPLVMEGGRPLVELFG
ncbi:DUF1501 domain-containing protein [Planctomyces sp. SH-PL62]|uniref:DUF1501 domain-containing protein n=1 Tax=Planctomyces sp. SH-PL62 TaxID=1636152 RepID=UPI00078BA5EE|nr:DUF1501 domain-containing protein [Planctomyces sp. SH-PL62]AMV38791.1 hypothetical protein VT85_15250 [Planctomyces sp. SH-PL62]